MKILKKAKIWSKYDKILRFDKAKWRVKECSFYHSPHFSICLKPGLTKLQSVGQICPTACFCQAWSYEWLYIIKYFWKKTKTTMWQRPCDLQSLKYLTTWPFKHLSTPGLKYIITRKMVTITTTSKEATESRKNGFVFFHYLPEFYIFCIICFYIIFVSLAFHELLFPLSSRGNLTKFYSILWYWNLFKRLMGESFHKILISVHTCQ